jgi:hypothetical protein
MGGTLAAVCSKVFKCIISIPANHDNNQHAENENIQVLKSVCWHKVIGVLMVLR